MKTIKTYWKFILYYAILLSAIVFNMVTDRDYVVPFILTVLLITIMWHLDYSRLTTAKEENDDLKQKQSETRKKYNKIMEVEKVRYSNIYAQCESLTKENDALKQTIHDLTEEKRVMRNKLNAIRRRRNQKKHNNE